MNMTTKGLTSFTAVLVSLTLSLGCSHTRKSDREDSSLMQSDIAITKSLSATRYSNLYFSGQPSAQDYSSLAEQGFKTVINLRSPDEYNEAEEKQTLQELNVNYYNIAFKGSDQLDDQFIDQVTEAVKKHRGEGKILIHCSSGNRVGIWLAGHFHKDHGYSKDKSLATAKQLGLNKPGAIKKAEQYLSTKND